MFVKKVKKGKRFKTAFENLPLQKMPKTIMVVHS